MHCSARCTVNSHQRGRVPNGFGTTADAYRDLLAGTGAWDKLHTLLDEVDKRDVPELARRAHHAHEIIYGAGLSDIFARRNRGCLPQTAAGVRASHGRHGISTLLSSTADGVVHSASCDVLAVRAT